MSVFWSEKRIGRLILLLIAKMPQKRLTFHFFAREEAWALYLAKLEEEANYFTVPETEQVTSINNIYTLDMLISTCMHELVAICTMQEPQEEICTCPTCTVS